MTDYLSVQKNYAGNAEQFNNDIKNLANSNRYLGVQKDGSITEIGLWDKICSVLGAWIFSIEDNTSSQKIDLALKDICVTNEKLIDEPQLDNILKIALHTNIVKNSNANAGSFNLNGVAESVHAVADILNKLQKNIKDPSSNQQHLSSRTVSSITNEVQSVIPAEANPVRDDSAKDVEHSRKSHSSSRSSDEEIIGQRESSSSSVDSSSSSLDEEFTDAETSASATKSSPSMSGVVNDEQSLLQNDVESSRKSHSSSASSSSLDEEIFGQRGSSSSSVDSSSSSLDEEFTDAETSESATKSSPSMSGVVNEEQPLLQNDVESSRKSHSSSASSSSLDEKIFGQRENSSSSRSEEFIGAEASATEDSPSTTGSLKEEQSLLSPTTSFQQSETIEVLQEADQSASEREPKITAPQNGMKDDSTVTSTTLQENNSLLEEEQPTLQSAGRQSISFPPITAFPGATEAEEILQEADQFASQGEPKITASQNGMKDEYDSAVASTASEEKPVNLEILEEKSLESPSELDTALVSTETTWETLEQNDVPVSEELIEVHNNNIEAEIQAAETDNELVVTSSSVESEEKIGTTTDNIPSIDIEGKDEVISETDNEPLVTSNSVENEDETNSEDEIATQGKQMKPLPQFPHISTEQPKGWGSTILNAAKLVSVVAAAGFAMRSLSKPGPLDAPSDSSLYIPGASLYPAPGPGNFFKYHNVKPVPIHQVGTFTNTKFPKDEKPLYLTEDILRKDDGGYQNSFDSEEIIRIKMMAFIDQKGNGDIIDQVNLLRSSEIKDMLDNNLVGESQTRGLFQSTRGGNLQIELAELFSIAKLIENQEAQPNLSDQQLTEKLSLSVSENVDPSNKEAAIAAVVASAKENPKLQTLLAGKCEVSIGYRMIQVVIESPTIGLNKKIRESQLSEQIINSDENIAIGKVVYKVKGPEYKDKPQGQTEDDNILLKYIDPVSGKFIERFS